MCSWSSIPSATTYCARVRDPASAESLRRQVEAAQASAREAEAAAHQQRAAAQKVTHAGVLHYPGGRVQGCSCFPPLAVYCMLVATAVAAPSRPPARCPTTHQAAAAEAAVLQSQLAEARVELSAREARLVALQGQLTAAEEGLQRQRQVR